MSTWTVFSDDPTVSLPAPVSIRRSYPCRADLFRPHLTSNANPAKFLIRHLETTVAAGLCTPFSSAIGLMRLLLHACFPRIAPALTVIRQCSRSANFSQTMFESSETESSSLLQSCVCSAIMDRSRLLLYDFWSSLKLRLYFCSQICSETLVGQPLSMPLGFYA